MDRGKEGSSNMKSKEWNGKVRVGIDREVEVEMRFCQGDCQGDEECWVDWN